MDNTRPTPGRVRLQEFVSAADSVLALPEAGALATQMALRSPTIGRWSLRSQCLLQLQEQSTDTKITDLGTRETWRLHGRAICKSAEGFYVLSTQNRERRCFRVFPRDQTRPFRPDPRDLPETPHGPGAVWLRTLRRELTWCGYALELREGDTVGIETHEQQVVLTARCHTKRQPLEALAQLCAGLLLAEPARQRPWTRAASTIRTPTVPQPPPTPAAPQPAPTRSEGAPQ